VGREAVEHAAVARGPARTATTGRCAGSPSANAYQELGELERAVDHHEQALAIYRAVGNRQARAVALTNLADSQLALGRQARRCVCCRGSSWYTAR
jgi:tetratricopeptide (TPR) repeat protein